jgi:hypothetical protein
MNPQTKTQAPVAATKTAEIKTELDVTAPASPEFEELIKRAHRPVGIFEDPDQFKHAQRVAGMLVTSSMVPEHFRGPANLGNAVIAVDMAFRLKLNPLMVMQNLFVIHGKPGMAAQLVIAIVNGSKQFSPLQYRMSGEGETRSCLALAKHTESGEVLAGPPVDIALAKREGWMSKNGSKWQTMPDLMLRYRAASWWSRLYAPELTMGLQTIEELQDTTVEETYSRPIFSKPVSTPQEPAKPATVTPESAPGTILTPQSGPDTPSNAPTTNTGKMLEQAGKFAELRKLCKADKIKETELVGFLIEIGSAEPGTESLETLALENESVLEMVTKQWGDVSQRILAARNVPE